MAEALELEVWDLDRSDRRVNRLGALRRLAKVSAAAVAAASAFSFVVPQAATARTATGSGAHFITPTTGLRPGVMPKHSGHHLTSAPQGAHLTYNGGRVISNINVVQVFYGPGTYTAEVSGTGPQTIASFYTGVTNSTYFDWLTEYNTTVSGGTQQVIGRGTFTTQVHITPSPANSGSTVDDSRIQAELAAQINAGHLPTPTGNTYYAVYFPANVTITQGGGSSGVVFCAYHGTVAAGSTPEFYYGVLPDFTTGGMTSGCGGGTRYQNETSVSSHEMIEAVTDPEVGIAINNSGPPLAWYDGVNGEIGDICNGQQQAITGGDGATYTVQTEFSNAQNNCVVHGPVVANDFSIALAPTTLSLTAGGSGTSSVNTAVVAGSAATIALSVRGVPSGASASVNPTSVTAGSSSTLTVNSGSAAPGNYTLTVTGVEGSKTHSANLALTITSPPTNDFSIALSPTTLTLAASSAGTSTVSTAVTSGAAGTVSLSVSGAPAGSSASLSPTSVTAGGASTLSVNSGSAAAGTYTLTVTGVEGTATHSATLSLTITAPPTNDFSIALSPTSLSLGTASAGTSTVSTAVTSGSAATVSLSVSGAPAGSSATLSPTSVTAGGSSILTVNSGSAAAGTYALTVTGTEGSKTHSATLALTITSSGGGGGITNGGFEVGTLSGWASTGSTSVVGSGAQAGAYAARVGSTSPSTDSSIAQTFTVPAGGTGLSFYYNVTCPDTITYDWATATLQDNTAGGGASTVLPKTCANPTSGWKQVTANLTAGHSYTLTLSSHDDNYSGDPTYTLYDSVAITTTGPPPPPPSGITNGGFENGSVAGWTTGGAHVGVTTSSHSGVYAALLGNTTPTNGDSTLSQTFTDPGGKTQLSLWYRNTCPDTLTYDWTTVTLRDNTAGTTATLLGKTCTASGAWTNIAGAVTAGHSYTLTLLSHDDNYGADPTYTLFDDVSLN